ncbi:MAG: RNase adapter RapZ [Cocleimonas sp.]
MHVVIISGMSGAGKSQVLNTLEDQGYYCIDNLPLELLANLFETKSLQKHNKVAIGIDIRSGEEYIQSLAEIIAPLKEKYKTDIVYLYAGKAVLTKRYDETRHKHPLSSPETTLREALIKEYEVLAPIREVADIQIDTSFTTIYELSSQIITRICNNRKQPLSLMFQSFGFKYGTPRDSDYLFDVRCLPNPYWIPELRSHTGLEKEVIEWLSKQELVTKMEQELVSFIDQWIPYIIEAQRSYLTVSIGCTGGHHRSVYLTEQLAKYFRKKYKDSVIVKHRELEK